MSKIVPVLKDEHNQCSIPTAWRHALYDIGEGLKEKDFDRIQLVEGVRPISVDEASRILDNVECYGATLTSLPEDTWKSSVCQWMIGYWDALVDLYTVEEEASDLVLVVRVFEEGPGYAFEICSVHVP